MVLGTYFGMEQLEANPLLPPGPVIKQHDD